MPQEVSPAHESGAASDPKGASANHQSSPNGSDIDSDSNAPTEIVSNRQIKQLNDLTGKHGEKRKRSQTFDDLSDEDEDDLSVLEPRKNLSSDVANKKGKKQTRLTKQMMTIELSMKQFAVMTESSKSTEIASMKLLAEMELKRDEERRKWDQQMDMDRRLFEEKLRREWREHEEKKERERLEYEERRERERREYEERRERERMDYEEKREAERCERDNQRWQMDKEFMAHLFKMMK